MHSFPNSTLWVQDPVDASPAVLVKRYNITQQKHLELQLTAHQDALQRWALQPAFNNDDDV